MASNQARGVEFYMRNAWNSTDEDSSKDISNGSKKFQPNSKLPSKMASSSRKISNEYLSINLASQSLSSVDLVRDSLEVDHNEKNTSTERKDKKVNRSKPSLESVKHGHASVSSAVEYNGLTTGYHGCNAPSITRDQVNPDHLRSECVSEKSSAILSAPVRPPRRKCSPSKVDHCSNSKLPARPMRSGRHSVDVLGRVNRVISPPLSLPVITSNLNCSLGGKVAPQNISKLSYESDDDKTSLSESLSLNDPRLNSCPLIPLTSTPTKGGHHSLVEHSDDKSQSQASLPSKLIRNKFNPIKYKRSPELIKDMKSLSTQTPPGWRQPESLESTPTSGWQYEDSPAGRTKVMAAIDRKSEPVLTWEEQFARRLFIGRRCWSFMSKGQKYDANSNALIGSSKLNSRLSRTKLADKENNQQNESGDNSVNSSKSKLLMSELKRLRVQNDDLQTQVRDIRNKLEQMSEVRPESPDDSSKSSVAELMATILGAQKERESITLERLEFTISERDAVQKQLDQLIDILLEWKTDAPQEENELDALDHDGILSSEEEDADDMVYHVNVPRDRCRSADTVDSLRDELESVRSQLQHEIKLRLIQQKKVKKTENLITSLHEKVARFLFQNFIQSN
ncbi:hypothetical protein HDE_04411 [Halotydeus destructor]|nr:hypothetical protein HDE_04411 [Halotydeus destructor]